MHESVSSALLEIFLVAPIYTLCLFLAFDRVMYNFRISPFKGLVFLPALLDIPEHLIVITNLLFFKGAPVLTRLIALLGFFKGTLGLLLVFILAIFLIAKITGVTGTIKIISYDDLWGNRKNVKTYWTWILGHVITAAISIAFIILSMLTREANPHFTLKWGAVALTFALIYDVVFNLFLKIPAHIFDKAYNHWLRAVFISADALFLMFALSLL